MSRLKKRGAFMSPQQLVDFLEAGRLFGVFDRKLIRIYKKLNQLPADYQKRLSTFSKAWINHELMVAKRGGVLQKRMVRAKQAKRKYHENKKLV